jgi:hypothetical protein
VPQLECGDVGLRRGGRHQRRAAPYRTIERGGPCTLSRSPCTSCARILRGTRLSGRREVRGGAGAGRTVGLGIADFDLEKAFGDGVHLLDLQGSCPCLWHKTW